MIFSNRRRMLCAQDYGIARGQTLGVATEKCMACSCFSVKKKCLWAQNAAFCRAFMRCVGD